MDIRKLSLIFVVLFSIIFAAKFIYLCQGNVLNHYPFISDDGFDWYVEGLYLIKLFSVNDLPPLPVLRPPIFVLITAADNMLQHSGIVLAFLIACSTVITYYFTGELIEKSTKGNLPSWYSIPLAVGTTFYSLNFIKPYILADTLAVAFSIIPAYLLSKNSNITRTDVYASIVVTISSLIQTYTLIPYIIFSLNKMIQFSEYKSIKKIIIRFTLILLPIIVIISVNIFWRSFIAHNMTPNNFSLLRFENSMGFFYLNTWIYFLLPIILILFLSQYRIILWDKSNFIQVSSTFTLIIFLIFCYFYQWQESRFTYYLFPWLLISFFSILNLGNYKHYLSIAILMSLVSLIFIPKNYWIPKYNEMTISIKKSWVVNYFMSQPIDRKISIFENPEENIFYQSSGEYIRSNIKIYVELMRSNK